MPVAASTISLLMLSLDRYATVKHPRLAQLRERRFLPIVLASGAWLGAFILCAPYLLSPGRIGAAPANPTHPEQIFDNNNQTTSSTGRSSSILQPHSPVDPQPSPALSDDDGQASEYETLPTTQHTCATVVPSGALHVWFVCVHTMFVFVIPAFGVLLNHLGVRKKLCALSLTARAAHGELPLPMPILRRPTHMIIVTGMANAGRAVNEDPDSSADEDAVDGVGVGNGAMAGSGVGAPDVVMSPAVVNGARHDVMVGSAEERRCMMAEAKMRCNPRTPR